MLYIPLFPDVSYVSGGYTAGFFSINSRCILQLPTPLCFCTDSIEESPGAFLAKPELKGSDVWYVGRPTMESFVLLEERTTLFGGFITMV